MRPRARSFPPTDRDPLTAAPPLAEQGPAGPDPPITSFPVTAERTAGEVERAFQVRRVVERSQKG